MDIILAKESSALEACYRIRSLVHWLLYKARAADPCQYPQESAIHF